MSTVSETETITEYAIRWDDGETQGPVSEEFARDVKADRDLNSKVTVLTRTATIARTEWVQEVTA